MSSGFSPLLEQLIDLALTEDLCAGDATTDTIFDGSEQGAATLVAKAPMVLAGAPVFEYVIHRVGRLPAAPSEGLSVTWHVTEGTAVEPGTLLASMRGPTVTLLRGERLALNFLQRLSGVATMVRRCQAVLGDRPTILDTRKTTPGLRELQRYAVRVGGGRNHRFNLGSGVMIKDNHIAAAGGIRAAVERVRLRAPHSLRIEVEVTTLDEVTQALDARADIIMLDNMDDDTTRAAIERIDGRALIEISGDVTPERLPTIATFDVDFVSSGALTHSVKAADISMRFAPQA